MFVIEPVLFSVKLKASSTSPVFRNVLSSFYCVNKSAYNKGIVALFFESHKREVYYERTV